MNSNGNGTVCEETYQCQRCKKQASTFCPKCMALKLPQQEGAYCSQDCFKEAWAQHKILHQISPNSYMYVNNKGKGRQNEVPNFNYSGKLRPSRVAPLNKIPDHIRKPDYYTTGYPEYEINNKQQQVVLQWTQKEIEGIRKACRLAREILDMAHSMVKPGVTTNEIDKAVHNMSIKNGAYPSPFNYHGFPKSVCTSLNEVICHGIPDMRELQQGDIVNIDVTAYIGGYHGDLNETYTVGEVDESSKRVIKTSHDCLMKALEQVKAGYRFRDIGEVISKHASLNGCSVVKTYCGHGCGDLFHCAPNVPHYANNKAVGTMKAGQVFTIEPMINLGQSKDMLWPDGWTSVTRDGKRSAQFEHQILVTDEGCEILTARLPTSPPLFWQN